MSALSRVRHRRKPRVHMLHIGKTGGTAVKDALEAHATSGTYRITFQGHGKTAPDLPSEDPFFFAVREPISRFVSAFYSRQRKGQPRHLSEWSDAERHAFERFDTANSLAEAIGTVDGDSAMRAIQHVRDFQADWVPDIDGFGDRIILVARQETLAADFAALCTALGLPALSLPEDDVRAHRNPANVDRRLTERAERNLREWYARDFAFVARCQSFR